MFWWERVYICGKLRCECESNMWDGEEETK